MKKTLLAAAIVLGFCGSASALPATATDGGSSARSESLQLVKMKKHKRHHHSGRHWNRRHHHWNRPHFGRYDRYRGWRRYHARPHRWRERGCVIAGPIWFCP